MTSRPYTGNSDGNHPAERPGTKRFVEFMEYLFNLKSLGIYANRPMRGSANLSVHATWRAVDLTGKGTAKQNADSRKAAVEFLFAHRDLLGIEEIHAYDGVGCPIPNLTKYGAGYRCDRDAWKAWTPQKNGGTAQASWFHCELAPNMADSQTAIEKAFAKIFG
jgi:hypothetical protein